MVLFRRISIYYRTSIQDIEKIKVHRDNDDYIYIKVYFEDIDVIDIWTIKREKSFYRSLQNIFFFMVRFGHIH